MALSSYTTNRYLIPNWGKDYNLRQCFFGEHLLPLYPDRKVFVVESEKTAVIASHFMPDVLWIATGGKNGCFNERAVSALAGRDVVLMPDLEATQEWQGKLPMLRKVCRSVSVNGILETMATDEQRSQGLDIADFLLMEDTPQMILQKMIDRNPALQTLIDELDLQIVPQFGIRYRLVVYEDSATNPLPVPLSTGNI